MTHPADPGASAGSAAPERTRRGPLIAWSLWDWGSAAFNHVITTFVFTVYLTSSVAPDPASGSADLGTTIAVAGLAVAVVAPAYGQRSDGDESRRLRRLGWLTAVTVVTIALMGLVAPRPAYLPLGLVLLGLGTVGYELAFVEYNALIYRLAPAGRTGRVSGLGWAAGYVGGIVLLALCLVLFLAEPPLIDLGSTATAVRVIAVVSAVWFAGFGIPVLRTRFPFAAPPADREAARVSVAGSYRLVARRLAELARHDRSMLAFLVSSAIFRDGLTGVFTFGGILAAGTFGLSQPEILVFAIVGNVVAAAAAALGGRLDDRFGPKPVIVASLVGLLVVAGGMLAASGKPAFWVGGLCLCLFTGPPQACSRSYLARLVPPGREGELFGLYATTGRAATFLAPALFALCVELFGAQRWGILGIAVVLALGLVTLLPVRPVAGRLGAGAAADLPAAPS